MRIDPTKSVYCNHCDRMVPQDEFARDRCLDCHQNPPIKRAGVRPVRPEDPPRSRLVNLRRPPSDPLLERLFAAVVGNLAPGAGRKPRPATPRPRKRSPRPPLKPEYRSTFVGVENPKNAL